MGISKIEWDTLRENARNAAVAVHLARERFERTAPPEDGSQPVTVEHEEARVALRAARDAWYDAFAALQDAIVDKLDLSYCAGEILDEDEAAEVAMQSPETEGPPRNETEHEDLLDNAHCPDCGVMPDEACLADDGSRCGREDAQGDA